MPQAIVNWLLGKTANKSLFIPPNRCARTKGYKDDRDIKSLLSVKCLKRSYWTGWLENEKVELFFTWRPGKYAKTIVSSGEISGCIQR